MAIKYTTPVRTNRAAQLNTDIGANAKLRVYSGTRPTTAESPLGGAVLLIEFACPAGAFGTATSGVLTSGSVPSATAVAGGVASFFRLFKADGSTAVMDGDVGTTGSDLNLSGGTSITASQSISTAAFSLTMFGA